MSSVASAARRILHAASDDVSKSRQAWSAGGVDVVQFLVTSVHACGRQVSWRVIAQGDLTVSDLIKTIAARSRVFAVPLREGNLVLAELARSRLYRLFDKAAKLGRLRQDDLIFLYEVPALDEDSGDDPSSKIETSTGSGTGCWLTVACHFRLPRQAKSTFFREDPTDEVGWELNGIPLLFRARADTSPARIYTYVANSLQDKELPTTSKLNFTLQWCESSRLLASDGIANSDSWKLDPLSNDPAGLRVSKACGREDREVVLLVADWSESTEQPPWVSQMKPTSSSLKGQEGEFLEITIGVDVANLVSRITSLAEERRDLQDEIADLKQRLGKQQNEREPQDERLRRC
eukprot:TRINITY_DN54726_c0_g1_i1.p1 TRINITY_DN54726_c0_g1~~TRINITY_DN54726_c0_g1_i1.p1  ORF type:complete len:348 (+),score=52.92 TRINITY_DN54726_c0_g1_i1:104-1147(+)